MKRFALASVAMLVLAAPRLGAETHRFTPTAYYNTYSFAHPPALRIKPGDRVVTKTIEAFQHATTELQKWLMADYGMTERGAQILMGQAAEYEIANVVDPNFTVVAKIRKALVPRR